MYCLILVLKALSLLVSDLFQSLRTQVLQEGVVMNLKEGVAIFPSPSFEVALSYQGLVQTKFGGEIQSVEYRTLQTATDTINRWARGQTGDQVQELVSNVDPLTQLLLTTAASYRSTYHLSEGGVYL